VTSSTSDGRLTLALPKGRILDELLPLFQQASIGMPDFAASPRAMVFDAPELPIRVLLLRGHDVPVYVAQGVADVGVAGQDVISEYDADLYSPLDLGIGLCWMSLIGLPGHDPREMQLGRPMRVATKFPRIAMRYFEKRGQSAQMLHLHGNVELAPLCGLSDCVVDLVSTGETLKRNGLVDYHRFQRITSRLVCNRAAYRLRFDAVNDMIGALRTQLIGS